MQNIKLLREKTGAGMVDCKKALDEAGGDIDKAVEILRKKGIAKAAKRGDREAAEGVIKIEVNSENNEGYILEINSETDFVARNDKFQALANDILEIVKEKKPADLEALLALSMADGQNVKDNLENLSGVIGEKLAVKRFAILNGPTIAAYSHQGGRIGVLISLDQAGESEKAFDVAMQIAASNPPYLNVEDVPTEEIDKEKDVYRQQLIKEGKPENILDNIINGKINKYYEDVCLVKQEFIKDDKKKVEDILAGAKINSFVRYSL